MEVRAAGGLGIIKSERFRTSDLCGFGETVGDTVATTCLV